MKIIIIAIIIIMRRMGVLLDKPFSTEDNGYFIACSRNKVQLTSRNYAVVT